MKIPVKNANFLFLFFSVWEEWAIRKYGGVGIAYNNPNVTFSKVDDMFKEEWAKRRPALANLSIWTLVSYARKFDSLKKQLIQDHNQGNSNIILEDVLSWS